METPPLTIIKNRNIEIIEYIVNTSDSIYFVKKKKNNLLLMDGEVKEISNTRDSYSFSSVLVQF